MECRTRCDDAAVVAGGSRGGHHGENDTASSRRALGQARLARLSDAALADEIETARAARWRPASLQEHAGTHWRDFVADVGHGLSPSELDELSCAALQSWDRLFIEIEPTGEASFIFTSELTQGGAILLVVSRSGRIRTAFPLRSLDRWLGRHPAAIEVTYRVQ